MNKKLKIMKTFFNDLFGANKLINCLDFDLMGSPLDLIDENKKNSYLFNIPISNIRSWGGRKLDYKIHPLLAVSIDYEKKNHNTYKNSALENFSKKNNFSSALDVFGLEKHEAPYFSSQSPLMTWYPWDAVDPKYRIEKFIETAKLELNIDFGMNENLSKNKQKRGELEFKRIISLYDKIKKDSFLIEKNLEDPISGELLIRGSEWVVLIRNGEHRVAVLTALNKNKFPIVINYNSIINFSEVDQWKHVKDGKIKQSGAIDIFNRIMTGGEDAPFINVVGWP